MSLQEFCQFTILGLTRGSLYALIALGYTLVYGVLQLINFAHSEVFMMGGFGGMFVIRALLGPSPGMQSFALATFYLVLGMLAGAAAGGLTAWVLERVAYRPLRKRNAPKLAFLISAIGASVFLFNFAGKLWSRQPQFVPQFFEVNKPIFDIFGATMTLIQVVIVGSAFAMMVFLDRLVATTKLGQGIRAVAQDAPTAALMGVDIDKTISRTFVLGGLLGGAAGFMFGMFSLVQYNMGFLPGIKAFAAAVLGGIGNIRGAMVGGLLLGLVENWSAIFIDTKWSDVIAFVALVLVLMFRPTGILGERLGRSA
ncbi:MAG TPA: branched-chain amino acid ABC transporter permease [Mycobacteriales bacterium]